MAALFGTSSHQGQKDFSNDLFQRISSTAKTFIDVSVQRSASRLCLWGSVEYFRDMVFNYPTLAEAYKVAALDGLNKL